MCITRCYLILLNIVIKCFSKLDGKKYDVEQLFIVSFLSVLHDFRMINIRILIV